MKYVMFAAALLALASAPTYSGLVNLIDGNGVLIGALVPGAVPLVSDNKRESTRIASAD